MKSIDEMGSAIRAHEGPALDTVGDYTVIDCQQCQFAHVLPLPDDETLRKFYDEQYYQQAKPNYFAHSEQDAGWWSLVHNERLAALEEWLQLAGFAGPDAPPFSILDVGSGPGLFLLEARKRGWETLGVEPSRAAHDYSVERYGLDVRNETFDQFAAECHSTFDAVFMGEVLEHVPNPERHIDLAHSLLNPNGLLLLVVPNDYSILQGAVEKHGIEDRWWLAPPQHLNYFNVRSLAGLVRRCGFDVADVSCTFPLELFILMGLNYIGTDDVGRRIHHMRTRLEIALEQTGLGDAKRELYRAFAKRGVGRDIVMIARKK